MAGPVLGMVLGPGAGAAGMRRVVGGVIERKVPRGASEKMLNLQCGGRTSASATGGNVRWEDR